MPSGRSSSPPSARRRRGETDVTEQKGRQAPGLPGGLRLLIRLVAPVPLVVVLGWRLGADPFLRAGHVLRIGPIAVALVLGLVTTVAQAMRWRSVAETFGVADDLTRGRAVREVYRASFLNMALPGALAGDALRAWRRRTPDGGGWRPAAGSVAVERLVGTAVLFVVAAVAALRIDRSVSFGAAVVALGAFGVSVRGLRRLSPRARLAVLGWSLLATAPLVGMFVVAAARFGAAGSSADVAGFGVILLAASSVPVGLAGFGPREAAAALVAGGAGLTSTAGVTLSTAYGLLAAVSVLPGALVMALDAHAPLRRGRVLTVPPGPRVPQIELHAHVLAEVEPSRGGTKSITQQVGARESQPRHPVPDE